MSDATLRELIKSDKRQIFPVFAFLWLTFALFEIETSFGSVSVATDDSTMPVWVGLAMVFTWIVMLYVPPQDRRKAGPRSFTVSYVTRNLADRVIGDLHHKGVPGWMLFTEAAKLKTEHHDKPDDVKNVTLNGLQLDVAVGAGILESAVLPSGETIVRRVER